MRMEARPRRRSPACVNPFGVEVDTNGKIYVTNHGNYTCDYVQCGWKPDHADDHRRAGSPSSVAVDDANGKIYVSNYANRP